jgi:hypothetical protein
MQGALLVWWLALCTAALVNAVAWTWSARRLAQRATDMPADLYATRRLLLWLSAVYVLGCGFRSLFPMLDAARLCLHDTWISRIVVGRSVATVAEMCFALQWVVLLREAAAPGERIANLVARLILPLIALAELSCWVATLRVNYLFHAIENSLWTLTAALVLLAILSLRARAAGERTRLLEIAAVCAVVYMAFMATVDVPMYVSRWLTGNGGVPLEQGILTVLARCVVVREWDAWRDDARWLTPYFTVVVWSSIALAHVPPLAPSRSVQTPVP